MYGHSRQTARDDRMARRPRPLEPVREGDKLYGRGGADDGYAVFASICALHALREQEIEHARVVVLIEFSEERRLPGPPAYVEHLPTSSVHAEPRRLSRFGRGQLRAALVNNVSARHRRRHDGCGRARRRCAFRRRERHRTFVVSPSPARSSRGSRTRRRAPSCPKDFTSRSPSSGTPKPAKWRVFWRRRCSRSFPGWRHASRRHRSDRAYSQPHVRPALAVTGQEGIQR